ncbi:hypothetical protein Bbelb_291620 [Branchiostoma belcheri]|nr:hypothetical protein Bbelb_291620 [Branchiostoma belcheri]
MRVTAEQTLYGVQWAQGDGRIDSPGHSAQYCTYTVLDGNTRAIVAVEVVDMRETDRKSSAMEKRGFEKALDKLLEARVPIEEELLIRLRDDSFDSLSKKQALRQAIHPPLATAMCQVFRFAFNECRQFDAETAIQEGRGEDVGRREQGSEHAGTAVRHPDPVIRAWAKAKCRQAAVEFKRVQMWPWSGRSEEMSGTGTDEGAKTAGRFHGPSSSSGPTKTLTVALENYSSPEACGEVGNCFSDELSASMTQARFVRKFNKIKDCVFSDTSARHPITNRLYELRCQVQEDRSRSRSITSVIEGGPGSSLTPSGRACVRSTGGEECSSEWLAETVLNWHKATDGRGLDQRTRRKYNMDMLAFCLRIGERTAEVCCSRQAHQRDSHIYIRRAGNNVPALPPGPAVNHEMDEDSLVKKKTLGCQAA